MRVAGGAAWLLAASLALPAQPIRAQARLSAGRVALALAQASTTPQASPSATATGAANIQTAPASAAMAGSAPVQLSGSAQAGPEPSRKQKAKAENLYLRGVRAFQKGDAAAAERDFARAAQADPGNREYDIDRQIAHSQTVMALVHGADKARIQGEPEVADAKLKRALALDPMDPEVSQHIDDLSSSPLGLSPDDATVSIAPAIELAPTAGKQSFHFRGTEQQVLQRVLTAYGLTPAFDSSVGVEQISFDADNVDFSQAAKMVQLATGSFLVPLDPKRVLVARDNRDNRMRYQRESVETLRLPGLSQSEMTDMGNIARNVLGVEHTAMQQSAGTITVRAPQDVLTALNRTFADLLEGKSEVLLDVRMFEVARTKTLNIGVLPPQSATLFNVPSEVNNIIQQNQSLVQQIISSGLANAGDYSAIAAILVASGEVSGSILGQPFALFGGGLTESGISTPGVTANLALNSTDTRSLDQVQLRLADNEEGTIRSGSRYPIETSSYSSLGASSVSIPGLTSAGLSSTLAGLGVSLGSLTSAETIPQVQYQDLGLTLTVTPKIERTDDVALKLDLKLTALQGTSLNGLPVLTNQSYAADASVQSGASAILVSNMSRQESRAVSGVPGLSDLPGFQSATNDQTEQDTSSLVIVITPHLLRRRQGGMVGPYIPLPLGSGN